MNPQILDADLFPDDPWDVREWDFPYDAADVVRLYFLLHYAVLAPSGHNTQPWRFELGRGEVALYADRTRALAVVDTDDRQLVMSCGTVLFHLMVAMRHYGYEPDVRLRPDPDDPDLMAIVRLGPSHEPTMEDQRLFAAIKRRRTNRGPFEERPVSGLAVDQLQAVAAAEEGVRLHVSQDQDAKERLAQLIAEGDRAQGADATFRRELASWIHPSRTRHRDGMPGYALRMGPIESVAGPLVVRTFDWGGGQAARDRQLALGSPALLVLVTDRDDEEAWLHAGLVLDHLLLTACDLGLGVSYLSQPVEVRTLRPSLADEVGSGWPQLVLRLGYPIEEARRTPRRPVREMTAFAEKQA